MMVRMPEDIRTLHLFNNRQKLSGGGLIRGIKLSHTYEDIISMENLLLAWREFVRDKRKRKDVQEFQYSLFENIHTLHTELAAGTYLHSAYEAFKINDPKPRDIHKATVRDRLLHHAVYRVLYPFFDRTFITDSYSCRKGKGTHKALSRFRTFAYKVGKNHTRTVWVLKCDIKKFFASIDHDVLSGILKKRIPDTRILKLLHEVISSFHSTEEGKGLPLGNLTSQLLVNIYMNEFDQYVKHVLKAKHYIRYADDFVFLSDDKVCFELILPKIEQFLIEKLELALHPQKVSIGTSASGVDFIGWVHFPDHKVLRTSTKQRMLRNLEKSGMKPEVVVSYVGLLRWGNAKKLEVLIIQSEACP